MSVKGKQYKCRRCGQPLVPHYIKGIDGRDTLIPVWDCSDNCRPYRYFEITQYLSDKVLFRKSTKESINTALREVTL